MIKMTISKYKEKIFSTEIGRMLGWWALGGVTFIAIFQGVKFGIRREPLFSLSERDPVGTLDFRVTHTERLAHFAVDCVIQVDQVADGRPFAEACAEFETLAMSPIFSDHDHLRGDSVLEVVSTMYTFCEVQYYGRKNVYEVDRDLCEGLRLDFLFIEEAMDEINRDYLINFRKA